MQMFLDTEVFLSEMALKETNHHYLVGFEVLTEVVTHVAIL